MEENTILPVTLVGVTAVTAPEVDILLVLATVDIGQHQGLPTVPVTFSMTRESHPVRQSASNFKSCRSARQTYWHHKAHLDGTVLASCKSPS